MKKDQGADFFTASRNLQALLATVNDMVIFLSLEGAILSTNPAVTEKLGYSGESLKGKSLKVLLRAEDAEEWDQILQKIRQIKNGTFRLLFTTHGEEIRQVEMDISLGTWADSEVLFAICRDITYRVEIEKSEHEQRVLASALADLASTLNSSLNIEDVVEQILESVGKVIPNTSCNIMIVEGNLARIIRSRGYEVVGTAEMLMARVFDLKKVNYLYKMAYSLEPTVSEDTATDPNWTLIPESLWVRSYVAAPITFQGKLFGFINCDSDQPGYYRREDAQRLKLFADQAGIAMENALLYTDTRKHARQMTLLNDLTRTSLNSDDFNKVLEQLPAQLVNLFQAQNVYITRLDETSGKVTCIATTHPHRSNFIHQVIESEECSLTTQCLEAGKAVFIHNGPESRDENGTICGKYPESSLLALPMNAKSRRIGAIIAGFGGGYTSSEVDTAIGEYAANQIAPLFLKMVSLDEERTLAEQLGHTNELISALSRVGTAIVSSTDTSAVMDSLGSELEKIGIHSMIALKDGDPDSQLVRFISQEQTMLPAIEKLLPEPYQVYKINTDGLPFKTEVFQDGKSQFIDDPASLVSLLLPEILSPFKRRLFSILLIHKETKAIISPLAVEGRIVGTLVLWGENIKHVDIEAFSLFGYQTSAALENAALMEKIKLMAITDEMTGIYNRRGINEHGQHEVDVASRLGRPLSAIMFDLDHFKIVNDTYGHPIGDQVLCEIVRRCKEKIREIDLFGRYGGEEFLLLIIGAGINQACAIAERLRSVVADTPIHTDAADLTVTISLGVTTLSTEIKTIEDMITAADLALYSAKNNGRNKVATQIKPGASDD
ncbi:MAG: diguanylate cyclase [Anaerolineaceae bacterium]